MISLENLWFFMISGRMEVIKFAQINLILETKIDPDQIFNGSGHLNKI